MLPVALTAEFANSVPRTVAPVAVTTITLAVTPLDMVIGPSTTGIDTFETPLATPETPPEISKTAKFSLMMSKASLNGSPVPSFAVLPVLICCSTMAINLVLLWYLPKHTLPLNTAVRSDQ